MVGGDGLQLRGTELEVTATERREMSVCVRVCRSHLTMTESHLCNSVFLWALVINNPSLCVMSYLSYFGFQHPGFNPLCFPQVDVFHHVIQIGSLLPLPKSRAQH